MPCVGCEERMSDPEGNFKMRFICGPDGKLLKGAPGNFECGSVHKLPFRHSRFKFWELIEQAPVLRVPDITEEDSVFDESVFMPEEADEEAAEISLTPAPQPEEEINIDPDAPAILESYEAYELGTTTLSDEPSEEPVSETSGEDLLDILAARGVEVKKGTRTTTLQKMVDELVSEG